MTATPNMIPLGAVKIGKPLSTMTDDERAAFVGKVADMARAGHEAATRVSPMTGVWRIRERGTTDTIAHVRVGRSGDVFVRWNGKRPWIEDFDALKMLLGDEGAVTRLPDDAPPEP